MSYKLETVRILIVDDFQPILQLLSDILRTLGFQNIDTAKDAQTGYDLLCKKDHDLVILDWRMEPINGLELCQMIRKNPQTPNPYVPILMISGYTAKEKVEVARDAGITEFLGKPFTIEGLHKRIEKIIERPRQFVKAPSYFGPDRRRRKDDDYDGKEKRESNRGKK